MAGLVFSVIILAFIIYQLWFFAAKRRMQKRKYDLKHFPSEWKSFLRREVAFYAHLDGAGQRKFEDLIIKFLQEVKIKGVKTEITDFDRLLVASAGIIPLYNFNLHSYPNLNEVLLYKGHFNANFKTEGDGRNILGMVGNAYLNHAMILSLQALRGGFRNARDGKNTAIHEFVHLIDGWDGSIDGIPDALIDQASVGPWLQLIKDKTLGIKRRKIKDIDHYATTNRQEFLAVSAEYYFENPERLKKNHPALYRKLTKFFGRSS